jgi:hypothetical protein
MALIIKKAILATSIALTSFQAQATLTSYNSNGVDLVYSSISGVTWTKDANLLGSMIAANGYDAVVNAIISITPTVTSLPSPMYAPTGHYTLSQSDFDGDMVTWYGAVAFVNYLNSIKFGGSIDWKLPTALTLGDIGCVQVPGYSDCGYDSVVQGNGKTPGNELAELYFNELGSPPRYLNGTAGPISGMPKTEIFDHEENFAYATGSEVSDNGNLVYNFDARTGRQLRFLKGDAYYTVWAITTGNISAVPEPENLAMLLAGLGLLSITTQRKLKV